MRSRGFISFWPIMTVVCAVAVVVLVSYSLYLIVVIPSGGYVTLSDNDVSVAVAFVLAALLFLVIAIVCFSQAKSDMSAAKSRLNAIERQVTTRAISKTSEVSGTLYGMLTTHSVAFDFPCRTRRIFEVNSTQFGLIVEGEAGILTYKQDGERFFFVRFQPSHL